ncbi:MAG: dipeptidase [Bryobacterales bacterium]
MTFTRRQFASTAVCAAAALSHQACASGSDEPAASEAQPAGAPLSLLERSVVLDLHCDTPMLLDAEGFDLSQRHDYGQVDIPRMREGGVSGVFFSIYTSATRGTPLEAVKKALQLIDEVTQEVARHPGDLVLATTAAGILEAKQAGKIAILMGVEGGHMIDSSLEVLRTVFRLGARYMTLTHSADTAWAGSSGSKLNKGLTEFGRSVVQEMNRLGMMVDISHVSDQTFQDALQTSTAPVIASHSSCRALAGHPRNMSDEMLKALAEKGGVIHINYYSSFLDDEHRARASALKDIEKRGEEIRKTLANDPKQLQDETRKLNQEMIERAGRLPFSRLIDHVEHAAKVAGVDHVGLGSDFDGVDDQLPEGMEDISKIPNLIEGLRERGFSDPDIEKILGANTLRVMREVEAAAVKAA